ncbi:basic secretory protein-like protein [uncultured Draconibacterium sp.]|uniref:basic secretory protein-like protein n=1 Tax=uncultured Draconibacterium sp. TaxID=1573823 RepID=UPI0029C7EB69|nr:basic secretory protein-like protein [uncultured Draconibacterium sp.]
MNLKPFLKLFSVVLFVYALGCEAGAQTEKSSEFMEKETLKKGDYTLVYINKDEKFSAETGQRLKDTFFEVYPGMVAAYNKNAATEVNFVIDPAYDGVAATSNGSVVFNPRWFNRSPGDIDVVTHEVMHIIQDYGRTPGPWWVTEGIADYVRYKYGVDNEGAGWSLPDVKEDHKYDSSYRITARFFVWIVQNKNQNFVKEMDKIMRDHTYNKEVWVELTGKNPAALWKEYIADPAI